MGRMNRKRDERQCFCWLFWIRHFWFKKHLLQYFPRKIVYIIHFLNKMISVFLHFSLTLTFLYPRVFYLLFHETSLLFSSFILPLIIYLVFYISQILFLNKYRILFLVYLTLSFTYLFSRKPLHFLSSCQWSFQRSLPVPYFKGTNFDLLFLKYYYLHVSYKQFPLNVLMVFLSLFSNLTIPNYFCLSFYAFGFSLHQLNLY